MRANTFLLAAALLSVLPPAPLRAQSTPLSVEQVVDLRRASDPQLSPDGSRVLFVTTRWRSASDAVGAAFTEIWRARADLPEPPERFTYGPKGDSQPRFSPDGRTVGFLSTRGSSDKAQLCLIPIDGGEARVLTDSKSAIAAFAFSPDGKRVAYIAPDAPSDDEEKAKKAGDDEVWVDHDLKQRRLFVMDLEGGTAKAVSPADVSVWSFDWAPDGQRVALVVSATPKVDDQYCFSRLCSLDLATGNVTPLYGPTGKLTVARVSPDGSTIAFLASGGGGREPYAGSLYVIPFSGSEARCLTADFDGTATNAEWSPKGDLYVTAIERELTSIYWVDPKTGNRRSVTRGIGALAGGALSFSADGTRFATVRSGPDHPAEVFIATASTGEMRRVTTLNPDLSRTTFGAEEAVSWTGAAGVEIEGVLVKPVGFEEGRRYPLVVYVHGGPESAETLGLHCSWGGWSQPLAQRGFAVLRPNYRGSLGRGVAFACANQKDLGGGEWQDILAGVDALVKRSIADPERLGIGGWSYGGYMTAWAVSQTKRFKAGVMGAGISNWVSMVGTSDITYENSICHWDSWAYDDFDLHFKRSGLAHVKSVETPLLILHGQVDVRVPLSQGQEYYSALRVLKKPVEMVTYPREPHGIGERAHQIDVLTRVLDWFDRHLNGTGGLNPSNAGPPSR